MTKNVFVLAGDYAYIRYIETTLKSLLLHNPNSKVYIFNQDIPQEWFRNIRKRCGADYLDLVDIKLFDDFLSASLSQTTNGHINYMTFARYFIPQYVSEDLLVYLDSDMIVTGSLSHLFDINLGDHYLAAASDFEANFNAGFLLINNRLWREAGLKDILIDYTLEHLSTLTVGDQEVLNHIVGERFLQLEETYNFKIGLDTFVSESDQFLEKLPNHPLHQLPLVLHYLSYDKPWNITSRGRLREVWWHYHNLEWSEIVSTWKVLPTSIGKPSKNLFILTDSCWIEQLDYLIENLPDWHFHIAAFTTVAPVLLAKMANENVTVYPNIIRQTTLAGLLSEADIYLDINHERKFDDILQEWKKTAKPILSFDNTNHSQVDTLVFPTSQPEQMVDYIRQYKS
ncbi:glycosyltransferase [Streptococcus loxodontisalivarius]|uniref:Lipopolysaccharide biosynthesis glycosyltransferase n=1 Tax=Streptococcus loxodontisalivarius TaxID=1349415 RepID=A0ABS2PQC5_9STRE|nr:glycosyltransferase [Streptococcus loxodontisalivarius]MBM7642237.1 lipopolysaccharide biosynthesis glycosyltransferase [Streptococcus loxodontisalivarius]